MTRDHPAFPALLALASCAILGFFVSLHPQGLRFYDPVIQTLALKHHEGGLSPSWNAFMRVRPDDLARSRLEWITWWPPSTQLLVLPLRSLGLNFAQALRIVALAAVAIGSAGWAIWFQRFDLPRSWIVFLAITLPWLHHASENLFRYSPEALAFAGAPWILSLATRLLRSMREPGSSSVAWAVATGLAAASAYWLKYSLFVTAIAALAGLGLWLLRFRGLAAVRSAPAFALALAIIIAGIGPLSLRLVAAAGGGTPLSQPHSQHFDWMGLVYVISNPALAAADAFGPLFFTFVYPGLKPLATHNMDTIAWIALPAGLLSLCLLIAALRTPRVADCTWVGAVALFITSAVIFVLWTVADLDHTSRLFAPAAIGALPILLASGRRLWSSFSSIPRFLLAAALFGFVLIPFAFGPFYVTAKVREGRAMRPGPTGLSVPNFTLGNTVALQAALAPNAGADAVWVVADPELALELPGRSIWTFAGRDIAEDLQNMYAGRTGLEHWRSSKPVRLLALLPRSYGSDVPALLRKNLKIKSWEKNLLPDPNLLLWIGTLEAGE